MRGPATRLIPLQDLDDPVRPVGLADGDCAALRTLAHWIRTFVVSPHDALGRAGPVCPFVPQALQRRTLWFAPEQMGGRDVPDVVELIHHYRKVLLRTDPTEGDGIEYKALVVAFTDLPAARAKLYMDDPRVQDLKRLCYTEDGIVIGGFHADNEGASIRNPDFRPFRAPVPFLLMRHGVLGDWKFFLDDEVWLGAWRQRFGDSAFPALAEHLRRTNWRKLEAT